MDDGLQQILAFEVVKSVLELVATAVSIVFFAVGAWTLWRYNRLLKSMRTCERCGREVLNRTASHCGRCGNQLRAAA